MKMKAAVRSKYGLPGDLNINDLDIPTPKDNEVLIRVHATTVNRSDCHVLSGKPFFMRFFTGLFKPRASVTGSDFAGEIAAIGSGVQLFKAGDKIMGFGGAFGCGSHAQYFILTEKKATKIIVPMPTNITYDEAAACLEGAFYAASLIMGLKPAAGQKALECFCLRRLDDMGIWCDRHGNYSVGIAKRASQAHLNERLRL